MKCKHCKTAIIRDSEDDYVHKRFIGGGVDARLCSPLIRDSKLAEPEEVTE